MHLNSIGIGQISFVQIIKGNQQNYINQNMKIAIKNNQTIKIYKGQFTFQPLTDFIKKEFNLSPSNYTLTYQDDEGDQITLASNQDMNSAYELNSQKRLLKAKITLSSPQEQKEEEVFQVIQPSPIIEEEVKEIKEVKEEQPKKEEIHEKKWHKWAHWGHKRQHHKQSSDSSSDKHHGGKGGFRRFHKIIDGFIAGKVDQRIKTLIPCLAAQLKGENPIKVFSVENSIVHENIDCKSCLSTPIAGIRYKCLTCPSFNLCENCEKTVQHEHNLLKMKRTEEENQKTEFPFKFLKKMWKHHRGERSCSSSKDKCGGMRITRKLAKIFGGKPQVYIEYAKSNQTLEKFQLINKYAKENGLSQKLVIFRCEKIANRLKKQPQEFKKIVEENLDLKPREIIAKLAQKGEVQTPFKWGKCGREERKCKKSNERKHHRQHQKGTCEQKFSKRSCQRKQLPTMLASNSSERTGKAKILENLVTLFGPNYTKQYFDLIEQHFSMGEEAIIDKWLQLQASV